MVMGNFTEQILVDTARVMSQERGNGDVRFSGG